MQFKKSLILALLSFCLIASPSFTKPQGATPSEKIQRLTAFLVLIYSNAYLHEMGHKYTAKWLTGAQSTIEMGILAGYAKFDLENSKILTKKPKPLIAMLLAGPLVGALGGLGIYGLASFLLQKDSFWYGEMRHAGKSLIWGNLTNLIPFNIFGFKSDGYQIWETLDRMQKGDDDKNDALEKLLTIPAPQKFALVKKIANDPSQITANDAVSASAA